jgi:general secretion pathway protein K
MSAIPKKPSPASAVQSGMVLIAVLWIVAALSIIVTGLTRSVRQEARVLAQARASVVAQAQGDAALQLVLQDLAARPATPNRLGYIDTTYRSVPVRVEVMPLNGLIDINNAPEALLTRLYTIAAGLPPSTAQTLAQATVQARERKDAKGVAERFEANEDLLRVPGIGYPLYARLAPLVTADLRGAGKVNPMAAPPEVLAVLAAGRADVAARIADARLAGQEGIDTTGLDAAFIDNNTSGRRLRLRARVPLATGAFLYVTRYVELSGRGRTGLPWYTYQSELSYDPLPSTQSTQR